MTVVSDIVQTCATPITNCTGGSSSPAASAGTGADAGKTVSAATGNLTTGSYSYIATIRSEERRVGKEATCEPFTEHKANTTLVTNVQDTAHNDITNTAIALGSVVHDTATSGRQVE